MFEVFHTDWPAELRSSRYFVTREEAQAHIDATTGGRYDSESGCSVPTVGAEFLSIREVERDSRPCRFCGAQVEAIDPTCDYCRSCYYNGRIFEGGVAGIIAAFKAHPLTDDDTVGVWHLGGGCFAVGAMIYAADGETAIQVLMSREASVDEPPSAEHPWNLTVQDGSDDDGESFLADDVELTSTEALVGQMESLFGRYLDGERS